jgi:hypothetical protein
MNSSRPVREPSISSDVGTPAVTATIVALIFFLLLFALGNAFNNGFVSDQTLWIFFSLALGVWLVVFFWSVGWIKKTIHALERVVNLDIDNDKVIGEPGSPALTNYMDQGNTKGGHPKTEFQKWVDGFNSFVDYCYANGTTMITLRREFTDRQIDSYRGYLISWGIGQWKGKNHKDGWEMTMDREAAQKILDRVDWLDRTQ